MSRDPVRRGDPLNRRESRDGRATNQHNDRTSALPIPASGMPEYRALPPVPSGKAPPLRIYDVAHRGNLITSANNATFVGDHEMQEHHQTNLAGIRHTIERNSSALEKKPYITPSLFTLYKEPAAQTQDCVQALDVYKQVTELHTSVTESVRVSPRNVTRQAPSSVERRTEATRPTESLSDSESKDVVDSYYARAAVGTSSSRDIASAAVGQAPNPARGSSYTASSVSAPFSGSRRIDVPIRPVITGVRVPAVCETPSPVISPIAASNRRSASSGSAALNSGSTSDGLPIYVSGTRDSQRPTQSQMYRYDQAVSETVGQEPQQPQPTYTTIGPSVPLPVAFPGGSSVRGRAISASVAIQPPPPSALPPAHIPTRDARARPFGPRDLRPARRGAAPSH